MNKRLEHDLIGDLEIDANSYYGIQTFRALSNFQFTRRQIREYPQFIIALAQVKKAAALANQSCGVLRDDLTKHIVAACDEVISGKLHEHFIVDPIQGGAGTSTNMNTNEVLTNRALELMGKKKGEYQYLHPNDHLNCSQSTNDAYPTAIKLGSIQDVRILKAAMKQLITSLEKKAKEFASMLKMGRTHIQDAVPMSVGQEFQAFADILKDELPLLDHAIHELSVINMGATAIGTQLNAPKGYTTSVVQHLSSITGESLRNHTNMIAATSDTGSFVFTSAILKKIALKLIKISNDLRLSASGPRVGLKEYNLPEKQPGSSIMPGKVNPVIPESVGQVCYQVMGNDLVITLGCENAQFQLNVFEPVMAYNLFESLHLLTQAVKTLDVQCIQGITVNAERCLDYVKNSVGTVTALNPVLGYAKVSEVAKEAYKTGKSVYDVVLDKKYLTKEQLDKLMSPESMIGPQN